MASIQAIVRCLARTASQVSGKVTTLLYNGKSVCCDTTPLSIENHLFRRVRSEDAIISRDETLGSTSLSIAFVLAPASSLWWKFPLYFEPFGTCCFKRIEFVLVHPGCCLDCVCSSRGLIDLFNCALPRTTKLACRNTNTWEYHRRNHLDDCAFRLLVCSTHRNHLHDVWAENVLKHWKPDTD